MELIKQLVPILLTVSLGLLVVAAGMASARGELAYVLVRPKLLLRALLAIDVIPVIAAIAIVALFPGIPQPAKAAIILMAISPVPPLVPGKAFKFGGHSPYVYGLQTAMALCAIVTVPILGTLVSTWYDADAHFPILVIAKNVLVGLIVPLIIGLALGRWLAPAFAQRAAPIVSQIGNALVVIAFIPVLIGSWHGITGLIGDGTVVAMAAVVTIAIVGGHLLGGPDSGDRASLAFASAMRHPGIALALVGANHGSPAISAGVLLFLFVGIFALIPYQIFVRRTQRKPNAATTGQPA